MAVKIGTQVSETRNSGGDCPNLRAKRSGAVEWDCPRRPDFSGQAGYSLVEMLVVIAIASVLLSIAAIGFYDFITNSQLNEYRDNILSYVQEARTRAITSVPHGIVFASNRFQFVRLKDGRCSTTSTTECNADSDCPTGEVCNSGDFMYDYPAGEPSVLLNNVLVGNYVLSWNGCSLLSDTTLWFDRKGIPRCIDWSYGAGTITITAGSRSKTLVIDSTGKVKYE